MQIGYTYPLEVAERQQSTLVLDGGALGPLLLPLQEASGANVGDTLSVFIYSDQKGNALPTLAKPVAQRDQCASMKVVDLTNAGAFLDWGIGKNLLLPFAQQRRPLEIGRYESVLVYLDNSGRLAATSRLDHHLPETVDDMRPWQEVNILIYQRTNLGLKAVVDNRALGLLYKDEIFENVKVGETHRAFVKRLRHDGRIDLALQPPSKQLQPELTERILDYLSSHDGICHLNDKSSPEEVQALFKVSKKNFKKALSSLYSQRKILIEPDRIILADLASSTGKD